jgi:outer membrane cobalamin receptor
VISVIEERSTSQIGRADAASEGVVGPKQLERRPILSASELLETVPGVIITQHSGSGKANQYFLRVLTSIRNGLGDLPRWNAA